MYKKALLGIFTVLSLPLSLSGMKRPADGTQQGDVSKAPRLEQREGPIKNLPQEILTYILTLSGTNLQQAAKSTASFLLTNKAYSQLLTDHDFLDALGTALAKKTGVSKDRVFMELWLSGLPGAYNLVKI